MPQLRGCARDPRSLSGGDTWWSCTLRLTTWSAGCRPCVGWNCAGNEWHAETGLPASSCLLEPPPHQWVWPCGHRAGPHLEPQRLGEQHSHTARCPCAAAQPYASDCWWVCAVVLCLLSWWMWLARPGSLPHPLH